MKGTPVTRGLRFDREAIDTLLLGGAFFIGISASLLLKYLDFPVWVPAVTSAVIIVLYAVVTFFSRTARLEPDQIGDNAYYLGFVLTLTSLAYTLWEMGQNTTNLDLINDVIAGFGIALSSTIVGVVVRVILLQYRVDLVARDKEARQQLNEAMQQFHIQVENLVRGMKYLSTEIVQTLEEHHQKIATSYEQRTALMVEGLVGTFQTSLDQVVDQSKEVNLRLSQSARRTMEVGQKASQEILNAIAENAQTMNDAYKESLNTTSGSLKVILNNMIRTLGETMGVVRTETQRTLEATSSAHEQNLGRQIQRLDASAMLMEESANHFTTKLKETLKIAQSQLQQIAEVSTQSLVQTNQTMAEASSILQDRSAEMTRQVGNLGNLMDDLEGDALKTLAQVSSAIQDKSAELQLQIAHLNTLRDEADRKRLAPAPMIRGLAEEPCSVPPPRSGPFQRIARFFKKRRPVHG